MSGQKFWRDLIKHKYDSYQVIGIQHSLVGPVAAQLSLRGLSVENEILDGMTRRKIRVRENWKLLTRFRDMTDLFTGNRYLLPHGGPHLREVIQLIYSNSVTKDSNHVANILWFIEDISMGESDALDLAILYFCGDCSRIFWTTLMKNF